jgi:hypothetical protein
MDVIRVLAILAIIAPLAACETFGTGGLCAIGPGRPQPGDVLTRKTKEWVVLVNETGEQVCGWKP